jgi:hypothetical protein
LILLDNPKIAFFAILLCGSFLELALLLVAHHSLAIPPNRSSSIASSGDRCPHPRIAAVWCRMAMDCAVPMRPALEGMQMKNSIGHPQGDKMLRKEDHVGIIDCCISRVENGRLEVKKKIPKEELVKHMPVRFNLSTMPA